MVQLQRSECCCAAAAACSSQTHRSASYRFKQVVSMKSTDASLNFCKSRTAGQRKSDHFGYQLDNTCIALFPWFRETNRNAKLLANVYEMLNSCNTWIFPLWWDTVSSVTASPLREKFIVMQTHSIKFMDFLSLA